MDPVAGEVFAAVEPGEGLMAAVWLPARFLVHLLFGGLRKMPAILNGQSSSVRHR